MLILTEKPTGKFEEAQFVSHPAQERRQMEWAFQPYWPTQQPKLPSLMVVLCLKFFFINGSTVLKIVGSSGI